MTSKPSTRTRRPSSSVSSYEPEIAVPAVPSFQPGIGSSYLVSPSPVRLSSYVSVDCFAMRVSQFLIDTITSHRIPLTGEGRFLESFYSGCLSALEGTPIAREIDDSDLLAIYLKQAVIILKTAGILNNRDGVAGVTDSVPAAPTLYARLFHAFWNDVDWDDIFTSSPELARELKKSRYILMDLTLKRGGPVEVDEIAGDFFELTGFSDRGDLFAISFLDFYFFTWLRHFGVIAYTSSDDLSPVSFEVTDQGRRLMKASM